VVVNIASRAATVDFPFAIGYNSSKAAVARATSTMQCEMELDGLSDIQFFALHPGGVPTAMAKRKSWSELGVRVVLLIRR
jgi:NAD(P)-dependent dehydrogenase (short-subunit alcohol dehydrogenase family)